MRFARFGATVVVLCSALLGATRAEDWVWIGPNNGSDPASGNFNTGSNWADVATQTINDVPGLFDTAQHFAIISGNPYTVSATVDNEIGAVQVLTESGGTTDNVTYDFNGNDLTLNGGEASDLFGLLAFSGGGAGSLSLVDGNYNVFSGFNVLADLDSDPSATVEFNVGAGARLTTDFLNSGTGADFVGGFGDGVNFSGTMNVTGGGYYKGNQLQVATDPNTVGVVNVEGTGSEIDFVNQTAIINQDATLSASLAVGLDGAGEMNVTNGATVTTQFLGLSGGFTGTTGTGSGTLNIDNATFVHQAVLNTDNTSFLVSIGTTGPGTMNVTNGGSYSSDFITSFGGGGFNGEGNITDGGSFQTLNLRFGAAAGSTGTLVADGGSITSGVTTVGTFAGGAGVVQLKNGGTASIGQIRLGEVTGGAGSLSIDGVGSNFVDTFGTFVGYNGTGDLSITNGGTLTVATTGGAGAGFIGVGRLAGSSGTVTVDGAGSKLEAQLAGANSISVGRDATGVMTIKNGGLVTTVPLGDVAIGRTATANGTVNVQSGGILRGHGGIAVGGSMTTGAGNIGVLNITGGGSIQTTHLRVYSGDTVNVNTNGFGTIGTIGTVVNTPNTLTVRTGGTLSGIGTINGNVANVTGGTVAPGLSPGLLTINGSLNNGNCVVGAGGTVAMEIVSAGTAGTNYDSLAVSGDVLLGGTLNLIVAGAYVPNGANQFNVITGTNNIVGAFESITNRVITAGVGGRVWGDYKENNAAPNGDRYYVAPRRQADFNGTGGVSGADYTIWADNFGKTWATFGEGDANGDRQVTGADYTIWADNFGQTSIGDGEAAVGTYGYGVDMASLQQESPVVGVDSDIALATLNGIDASFGTLSAPVGTNAVPEPSSVILGGLALLGFAGWAARRSGK